MQEQYVRTALAGTGGIFFMLLPHPSKQSNVFLLRIFRTLAHPSYSIIVHSYWYYHLILLHIVWKGWIGWRFSLDASHDITNQNG